MLCYLLLSMLSLLYVLLFSKCLRQTVQRCSLHIDLAVHRRPWLCTYVILYVWTYHHQGHTQKRNKSKIIPTVPVPRHQTLLPPSPFAPPINRRAKALGQRETYMNTLSFCNQSNIQCSLRFSLDAVQESSVLTCLAL